MNTTALSAAFGVLLVLAAAAFFFFGRRAGRTAERETQQLAKASARPRKFVGIHFFSPVDKMKLVEIILGKETEDETVARA